MTANKQLPIVVYDIGGSHISVALCHKHPLRLDRVCSAQYPSGLTATGFFHLLYDLGAKVSADSGELGGAQLAVPNPFDTEAGISLMRHKLQFLFGLDMRRMVAESFGWHPEQVRFVHDATAFLRGEMAIGAAQGAARAVGITLGTGVGSAFCRNGRLITHDFGVPPGGEIWNLPFKGGILEDFVSSRAIQRGYQCRTGRNCDVASLNGSAREDAAARESFAEFGSYLGQALRSILPEFAPDLVVIGGGIAHAADLFLPSLQLEMKGLALKLVVSSMLDRAALAGAAAVWFNDGIDKDEPAKLASATARTDAP